MLCEKLFDVFHGTVRYSTGCFPDRFVLLIYVLIYSFSKLTYVQYKSFEFYFLGCGNDLYLNLLIPSVTEKYAPTLSAYAQLEAAQQQSNKRLV